MPRWKTAPNNAGRRRHPAAYLLLVVLGVVLFHGFILRSVFAGLVHHDRRPMKAWNFVIVLFGDDQSFLYAAKLLGQGAAEKILIVEPQPDQITELGIFPRLSDVAKRDLLRQGVPKGAISVMQFSEDSIRPKLREIDRWLQQHRAGKSVLLSHRHMGRYTRYAIDAAIDDPRSAKLDVYSMPVVGYSEAKWWRSLIGARRVCVAYLRLFHLWWNPQQANVAMAT